MTTATMVVIPTAIPHKHHPEQAGVSGNVTMGVGAGEGVGATGVEEGVGEGVVATGVGEGVTGGVVVAGVGEGEGEGEGEGVGMGVGEGEGVGGCVVKLKSNVRSKTFTLEMLAAHLSFSRALSPKTVLTASP